MLQYRVDFYGTVNQRKSKDPILFRDFLEIGMKIINNFAYERQ